MYVSVKFHKPDINAFGGMAYTYETHISLKVWDRVMAPVRSKPIGLTEPKKAIVVEVDLPKPDFPCNVITETWEEAQSDV